MKIISKKVQVYKKSDSWIIQVSLTQQIQLKIHRLSFRSSHAVAKRCKIPKYACHCDQYEELANNLPSTLGKLAVF
jgi:hypothetical protein